MPAHIAPSARPALAGARGTAPYWDASAIAAWAATGAAVVVLYHSVLTHLVVQWWEDPNQSHGFLVPLVALFMVWERRERLAAAGGQPGGWGLVLMGAGIGMLVLGQLAAELFLQRVSLLVTLAGAIAHLLGRGALRVLAVPLLFLLLMIPPPAIVFNAVALPLQGLAARLATVMLDGLGVPVLREGNLIVLATTTLEVAEACSGIRSLITLLALGATLAYLAHPGPWRAAAIVLSAVPVAVLANAARVGGTGAVAAWYGPETALGFLHTFSGWLVFLLAAGMLLGVTAILVRGRRPLAAAAAAPAAGQGGISRRLRVPAWRVVSAAAVLVAGAGITAGLAHREIVPLARPFDAFPDQIGPWRGTRDALPSDVLDVLRVTDYMHRLYAAPHGPPVWLYVGYYASQRQGQIVHSPQQCLPGAGWTILSRADLSLAAPGRAEPVVVNRVLIARGQERQVVLYWYQERGRVVASEYAARLHLLADAIGRNRTDGALVRLSAPVVESDADTTHQLVDFATAVFPHLAAWLPA